MFMISFGKPGKAKASPMSATVPSKACAWKKGTFIGPGT